MKRRGKIRRSSMVEEVPVKFSKKLDLSNENTSQCPVSNMKPSLVKEIIKTLLILASIFSVFLLKGNTSVFRFNTPSRVSLLSEIHHLKHDLESYERLKKQLADKEVQLKWDRQRIQESEEIVNGMVTSSQDLSARLHEQEQQDQQLHEEIQVASKQKNEAATRYHESTIALSRDIKNTYVEAKHEQEDIAELRRQISQTMKDLTQQNIDVPKELFDRLKSKYAQAIGNQDYNI
eukprot:scaffold46878_cov72-Cyclotella_meneghiniana.AAC.2